MPSHLFSGYPISLEIHPFYSILTHISICCKFNLIFISIMFVFIVLNVITMVVRQQERTKVCFQFWDSTNDFIYLFSNNQLHVDWDSFKFQPLVRFVLIIYQHWHIAHECSIGSYLNKNNNNNSSNFIKQSDGSYKRLVLRTIAGGEPSYLEIARSCGCLLGALKAF